MGWKHNILIIKCNKKMVEEEAFQRGSQNTKDVCVFRAFVGFLTLSNKRETYYYYGPHNFISLGQFFGVLNVFPSSFQGVLNMFPKFPMCLYQHVLNSASLCPIHFWLYPLGTSLGGPILRFLCFFCFGVKIFLYWGLFKSLI